MALRRLVHSIVRLSLSPHSAECRTSDECCPSTQCKAKTTGRLRNPTCWRTFGSACCSPGRSTSCLPTPSVDAVNMVVSVLHRSWGLLFFDVCSLHYALSESHICCKLMPLLQSLERDGQQYCFGPYNRDDIVSKSRWLRINRMVTKERASHREQYEHMLHSILDWLTRQWPINTVRSFGPRTQSVHVTYYAQDMRKHNGWTRYQKIYILKEQKSSHVRFSGNCAISDPIVGRPMKLQNMCETTGGMIEPVFRNRYAQWKPKSVVYDNCTTTQYGS